MGYSDASWGNDIDGRHSTSGVVFLFAGSPVAWVSKLFFSMLRAVLNGGEFLVIYLLICSVQL